ncbi:MAG: hypothetical protein WA747_15665 [Steroidobacteraceae bacterium]
MRNLSIVSCLILLCACSAFGGGAKTEKGYVGPASLDEQQVTQLLNQNGYSNIEGLHKNGSDWVGGATNRSGQQVNFDIDKDGTINTK